MECVQAHRDSFGLEKEGKPYGQALSCGDLFLLYETTYQSVSNEARDGGVDMGMSGIIPHSHRRRRPSVTVVPINTLFRVMMSLAGNFHLYTIL